MFVASIITIVATTRASSPGGEYSVLGPFAPNCDLTFGDGGLVVRNGRVLIARCMHDLRDSILNLSSSPIDDMCGWSLPQFAWTDPWAQVNADGTVVPLRSWLLTIPMLPLSATFLGIGLCILWRNRSIHGRCSCGYALAGLAPANNLIMCPECGTTHVQVNKPTPC